MTENPKREEILQNMKYSYSSVSGFFQCKLAFVYNYFYRVQRAENIFAQIGTVSHEVMEEYMAGNIEVFELEQYFRDKYAEKVTCSAPSMLGQKFEESTIEKMTKFFSTTDFDRESYEILCMENKYEHVLDGDIKLVVKPDLIVRRKTDGKVILYDYKTSSYKKDSHAGYAKQCSLYKAIFEIVTGIHVDEMKILYFKETVKPRGKPLIYGRFIDLEYNENILEQFISDVKAIRAEKEWSASPDEFFCNNLCSARIMCDVKEKVFGF